MKNSFLLVNLDKTDPERLKTQAVNHQFETTRHHLLVLEGEITPVAMQKAILAGTYLYRGGVDYSLMWIPSTWPSLPSLTSLFKICAVLLCPIEIPITLPTEEWTSFWRKWLLHPHSRVPLLSTMTDPIAFLEERASCPFQGKEPCQECPFYPVCQGKRMAALQEGLTLTLRELSLQEAAHRAARVAAQGTGFLNPQAILLAAANALNQAITPREKDKRPPHPIGRLPTRTAIEQGRVTLVVEISRICLLGCPYCFRKHPPVSSSRLPRPPQFMSPFTLHKILSNIEDYCYRHGIAPEISIILHGAEPFLVPPEHMKRLFEVLKRHRINRVGVQSGLYAPLSRIRETYAAAKQTGVILGFPGTSYDPSRPISVDEFFARARKVREIVRRMGFPAPDKVGFIAVVNELWKPHTLIEAIAPYRGEIDSIQFNPVFNSRTDLSEGIIDTAIETMLALAREGFTVQHLTRIANRVLLGTRTYHCWCEPLDRSKLMGVSTDGLAGGCDIWPAWRLPTLCWGNLKDHPLEEVLESEAREVNTLKIPTECLDCPVFPDCLGGCPLRHTDPNKGVEEAILSAHTKAPSCRFEKKLIEVVYKARENWLK